MDDVLRIEPTFTHLRYGDAPIPIGDIALGGIPRGAALVLCEPGQIAGSAVHLANLFAEHGYDVTMADVAGVDGSNDAVVGAVDALLDHLGERGWRRDQVGVVGYGEAGHAAYVAATACPVGAAVSAAVAQGPHEPGVLGGYRPESVRVPWLGLFGVRADAASEEIVGEFRAAVDRLSPVYTQVVAYPGVSPLFLSDSRDPLEHAVEFESWQRTLEWFNLRVVPRPSPLALAWTAKHPTDEPDVSTVPDNRWSSDVEIR